MRPREDQITFEENRSAAGALLRWYAANARDLPWRRTSDPYAIWLSEIMLQQTRVETVINYYNRFLSTFPTIEALASADIDKILKLWEGLGYYRRARHLHAAAKQIVNDSGGIFPREFEALKSLSGIGNYTAAAIASIAFGGLHAVLDGNVKRVLARIFQFEDAINTTKAEKELRRIAQSWMENVAYLDVFSPSTWNQAMMELGAIICTPEAPDCTNCPCQAICLAQKNSLMEQLPKKRKKHPIPTRKTIGLLLRTPQDEILIWKRKQDEFLGGLWEIPMLELATLTSSDPAAEAFKTITPVLPAQLQPLGKVTHIYSHFRRIVHLYIANTPAQTILNFPDHIEKAQWIPFESIELQAFHKVALKCLDLAKKLG